MCLLFASCLNGSGIQVVDVTCFGQVDLWRLRTSEFTSPVRLYEVNIAVNLNISEPIWTVSPWLLAPSTWARKCNDFIQSLTRDWTHSKYSNLISFDFKALKQHLQVSHFTLYLWNSVRKEFLYGAQVDALPGSSEEIPNLCPKNFFFQSSSLEHRPLALVLCHLYPNLKLYQDWILLATERRVRKAWRHDIDLVIFHFCFESKIWTKSHVMSSWCWQSQLPMLGCDHSTATGTANTSCQQFQQNSVDLIVGTQVPLHVPLHDALRCW